MFLMYNSWQWSFCSCVTGMGPRCCQQEIPDAPGSAFAPGVCLNHTAQAVPAEAALLCPAPRLILFNHTGEGCFDKAHIQLISSLTLKSSSFNNSFLLQVQGLLYLNKLKSTLHTSKDHILTCYLNAENFKKPQGFGLPLSQRWWNY